MKLMSNTSSELLAGLTDDLGIDGRIDFNS